MCQTQQPTSMSYQLRKHEHHFEIKPTSHVQKLFYSMCIINKLMLVQAAILVHQVRMTNQECNSFMLQLIILDLSWL